MLQSDGVPGTPQLDYDAWREMLRSMCGRLCVPKTLNPTIVVMKSA
jgi:hypothetical protein